MVVLSMLLAKSGCDRVDRWGFAGDLDRLDGGAQFQADLRAR